jgi:hypothetical protein
MTFLILAVLGAIYLFGVVPIVCIEIELRKPRRSGEAKR